MEGGREMDGRDVEEDAQPLVCPHKLILLQQKDLPNPSTSKFQRFLSLEKLVNNKN